jgi:hypothetical protein
MNLGIMARSSAGPPLPSRHFIYCACHSIYVVIRVGTYCYVLPLCLTPVPERYQLLYLSRLSADTTPLCVAEIVRAARQLNQAQRISSLLVFDGLRFCQYLAGEAASVRALAERIRADPRHADFILGHEGVLHGPSLLGRRSLGYALCYDDSLDRFERAGGAQAVELLASLLPSFDREAESPRP